MFMPFQASTWQVPVPGYGQTAPAADAADAFGSAPAPDPPTGGGYSGDSAPAPPSTSSAATSSAPPPTLTRSMTVTNGYSTLTRSLSEITGIYQINWTVDARRLNMNVLEILSPMFDISLAGKCLQFKMCIIPKQTHEGR